MESAAPQTVQGRPQAPSARRQRALVPKELVWPLCQRLFLVILLMSLTALGIRLHSMFRMGKLSFFNNPIDSLLRSNHTHFFLDIGSGNHGLKGFSHTQKLEDSGWKGVCADPFPDNARACTTLAMPVTPQRGQSVKVSNCTGQPITVLMAGSSIASKCAPTSHNGISIVDVLKLSQSPHIIDYVSLDTQGSELDVLNSFPFQDYCVRSWTVQHRNEAVVQAGTKAVLESRKCDVLDTGSSHWARCKCGAFAASLLDAHDAGSLLDVQAAHHKTIVRQAGHSAADEAYDVAVELEKRSNPHFQSQAAIAEISAKNAAIVSHFAQSAAISLAEDAHREKSHHLIRMQKGTNAFKAAIMRRKAM